MAASVLDRQTLVLNRHWQPVHVTSVSRALTLIWNDAARVVEPDEYTLHDWSEWVQLEARPGVPVIRSARMKVRVPEVVCLVNYDRLANGAVTFSRRNVAKRDHHTCQYCGAQPGSEGITIDHILPRSRGGATNWLNCVAACIPCNSQKANRTPEQAGMKLRKAPARPEWKPLYSLRGIRNPTWSRFIEPELDLVLT